MNVTESAIRAVKDRIAAALGELDEAASQAQKRTGHSRLSHTAAELHKYADELQTILMRIKPR